MRLSQFPLATTIGKVKGIKTIAECVETPEALAKLRELGVDYAQGHLIHHPEPWEVAAPGLRMVAGGRADS